VTDRGDHVRFAEFYRETYSLILTTCERRLSDRKAAEDATAEAFRVAWERAKAGKELTLPWLYVVARNLVGREYRRNRRTPTHFLAAADTEIEGSASSDRALEVRAALSRLKPAERELLFMAYWEDLTPDEMARILGCSVPTLWVRLNRARTALRQRLSTPVEPTEVGVNG
jgi:RNA polymerase sigma-70 factor (ECF subfamily)